MSEKTLSDIVEELSDEFQSTFTVVSENVLANMLGIEGDFNEVTRIVRKYIPDAVLEFQKTKALEDNAYDVYRIRLVTV